MIVVASAFLNNSLSELHVKYFSWTFFRMQQWQVQQIKTETDAC